MKRFLSATLLCAGLLLLVGFVLMPSTGAQTSVVPSLLMAPAPPPPNPVWRPELNSRDENFYDKKKPPADTAPTADLLDYWKAQNQFDPKYVYTAEPSPRTVERLLAEASKKPETLPEIINTLPESRQTAEFVKRMYDEAGEKYDEGWRDSVKKWLTYHTSYFADELAETAAAATDANGYVTNQDEVLALARVDFDKARPLLDKMLADTTRPVSQTLARWAYYKHAVDAGDSLTADTYRKLLQQTVEDKSAGPGNRDLAMDAIVESGDFSGRDDWYLGLMEDETLHDLRIGGQTYTGLTTIINHSPNDKYLGKMIELTSNSSKIVRTAAARNLVAMIDSGLKSPDIVKALLPWLEDKNWVGPTAGDRSKVISLLLEYEIPESVNGLVALLNEKEEEEPPTPGRPTPGPTRTANANVPVAVRRSPASYPYRNAAISALVKQKSSFAAGPLRQLLPFVDQYLRPELVKAILVSNGFTIGEQVGALEFFAVRSSIPTPEAMTNAMAVNRSAPVRPIETISEFRPEIATAQTPLPQSFGGAELNGVLGAQIASIETPSDELVRAVIERIALHEKKNPKLAEALRGVVENWKGPAINSLFLRDVRDGRANANEIIKLLTVRRQLRESQLDDVNGARGGGPAAMAIGACILEDANEFEAIIDGDNTEAKSALLACARLIRGRIAIAKVAPLLDSPDKLLARAAEAYLVAEDSPQARRIILARHPNDALVLGAAFAFPGDAGYISTGEYLALFGSVDELFLRLDAYLLQMTGDTETQDDLRKELKSDEKLLGIYAYDSNFIRLYADRAVFSWTDDPARFRQRTLTAEEFGAFSNFLASNRVDELTPFLGPCDSCESKELLMLGKAGGRRVFVHADPLPPFFEQLDRMFEAFRQPPSEVHYYLEKDIKDLRVHFADPNYDAITLWKNGGDFRLLLQDSTVRKRLENESEYDESEYEGEDEGGEEDSPKKPSAEEKARIEKAKRDEAIKNYLHQYETMQWFSFDGAKIGAQAAQPDGAPYVPTVDGHNVFPSTERWKTMAPGVEVRIADDAIYKIQAGKLTKLRDGSYSSAVVTTNGRWAVALKYSAPGVEDFVPAVYRINLATGREFRVNIQTDVTPTPATYDPFLNRVVLFGSYSEEFDETAKTGEIFLLDPDTGAALPYQGEASPLVQPTFRALQPTAASPETVWAAIPDGENATAVGTYNLRTLAFKKVQRLPKLEFDSMSLWVDEPEKRAYVVYKGQVISFPLK